MSQIILTPEQMADRDARIEKLNNCFKHNNDVRRLLLYGGSRCLGGNTIVVSKKLGFTEIKNIKPDDFVLSDKGWTRVLNVFKNKKYLLYNAFDNGYDLLISADHRIKTSKGWIEYGNYLEKNTVIRRQVRSQQYWVNSHDKLEKFWQDEDNKAIKVRKATLFEKYVHSSGWAISDKTNSCAGSRSILWHKTRWTGYQPYRRQYFEQQYRQSGILHAFAKRLACLSHRVRTTNVWRKERNAQIIKQQCAVYQRFLSECEETRFKNSVQDISSRDVWCESSDYKRDLLTKKKQLAWDLETDKGEFLVYTGFFFTVHNSSKTFRGCRKLLKRAVYYPGSRHLIARDTFTAVRNAIILDTFPKLLRLYYPQLYEHWCNGGMNNSTNIFTLPNGSEIHFRAIGNEQEVEKLLGTEYATILIDEASEVNYEALQKLRTRLAQKVKHWKYDRELKLMEIVIENPPHKGHWTYKEHFLFQNPLDPEKPLNQAIYANVRLNPMDNLEYLPDEYIESLMELPAHEQTRFLYGEFGEEARGSVLAVEFAKYPNATKQRVIYDDRYPVYTAWDIGHTDATAIWFYQWIDGRVKVINYMEDTMKALPYWVEQLQSKPYKYDLVFFPHDGVNTEWAYGNTRVARMREIGFNCITLERIREQEQIDIARSMIPIIDIDKDLSRGIECIMNMRYDYKDGVLDTKNIVHDEYSHGGKAFLYLCQSVYKDRDEKRVFTEAEKREKLRQSIADDIRKGLEANKEQLKDDYDYTRVESNDYNW